MNAEWRTRYELAVEVARTAGDHARRYYETTFEVQKKADSSPVTIADREAEQIIRGEVAKRFPDDGFLGEEFGDQPGPSGFRWVIDPIDGTRSFVRHIPIWATLVGIEYNGETIGGICYLPCFKQTHRGWQGDGAYRDDKRIRVSGVSAFGGALLPSPCGAGRPGPPAAPAPL